jgi:hypothetical protein
MTTIVTHGLQKTASFQLIFPSIYFFLILSSNAKPLNLEDMFQLNNCVFFVQESKVIVLIKNGSE